jgi:uncharacterized membrane protein SirB2
METSQQLSLAIAGIAITILGISITLMVQWAALPKKNQVRNLAFLSSVILFIAGLALLFKAVYVGWGWFRGVLGFVVVVAVIALGLGIAPVKKWIQKRWVLKRR